MASKLLALLGALSWLLVVRGLRDESEAAAWLDEYYLRSPEVFMPSRYASWNYNTNLTDYNSEQITILGVVVSKYEKEVALNASEFDWRNFQDDELKRQFNKLVILGTSGLDESDVEEELTVGSEMKSIYSTATVCGRPGHPADHCFSLDPDLTRIMSTSTNWDELKWAWQGWREQTGRKMADKYKRFVELNNMAAVKDGFDDTGEYWRSWYEMEGFEAEVLRLWTDVEPLYKELHAYVRRKLEEKYKDNAFPKDGRIPAHLLGNMWSQTWNNIAHMVLPHPDVEALDITDTLVEKDYNVTKMFRVSEEFFTSLGMGPMSEIFWERSMLEKPDDGREVVCHASAWDFRDGEDFRVKMCTDITGDDLDTIHHEMGHIQYYMEYKEQPVLFRRGANPGFHEAVGDTISLSVTTPEHLHKIGLLENLPSEADAAKADLNYLMTQALQKIAFLPFGFLMDQWRWSVFRGETTRASYNDKWWELRCKYQGIAPPVERVSQDFDPGAKYHIPANTPYVRYFVSFILQFQFHRSLCEAAGHTGNLHSCDIYKSTEAGTKLRNMLKMGSSKPWPEALEPLTGVRTMDAHALMDYFKPLTDWLKVQNQGHSTGWTCDKPTGTSGASVTRLHITLLVIIQTAIMYVLM